MRSVTSTRGSALIVALIFAVILAISITSYLKLALNAGNLANRSFYFNAAHNLVDTGFEHVIWSLSEARFTAAPANWTNGGFAQVSATEYRGTFPTTGTYSFAGGATGQVKVWSTVINPTAAPANFIWHTVAEATITLGDKTNLRKMAECYLRQRSFFDKGMVAKDGITFTGQGAMVDSWRSRWPTINDDVLYSTVPYDPSTNTGVRRDNATIAGLNFVSLQNGDVYGKASIGGSSLSNFTYQQNNGTLNVLGATGVDQTRISLNFTSNFPEVKPVPSGGTALGAVNTGGTVLTTNTTYSATSISLQNNETFEIGTTTINADAVLVVTGDVTLNGSSKIIIHPGSSLKMYVGGDFSMVGQSASIVNGTTSPSVPSNPDRCQIFGTGTTTRTWNFNGNASSYISAAVYAPYANIGMSGGGTTYGAMVGNTFTLNGGGSFHQDESLADLKSSGIWGLAKWRELSTAADRAAYATQLAF
jgi:hypothetical protein